jgi:D-lactate dehydrogenase
VPVTFRAAGTSLCGQTVGSGLVAEVRTAWERAEVRDEGAAVWVEPGVTVSKVNSLLEPLGRRLGPDPESADAAMMGGVLANNSGGPQSGVEADPYATLQEMELVLANGHRYNTGNPEDRARFASGERAIHEGLAMLRDQVRGNERLVECIRRKYRIKNVMGYGLRSFLDVDEPIDILARLLIGSEGTLAFIASATLATVPLHPCWSAGLLFFRTVRDAVAGVQALVETGAAVAEFMDRACLRAWKGRPGVPAYVDGLPAEATAVLLEYRAATETLLRDQITAGEELIADFELLAHEPQTSVASTREQWFALRSAMYPLVAATRRLGSSVIVEDVAAPTESVAELIVGLRRLFDRYDYVESSFIFGHLASGNVHFIMLEDLSDPERLARYGSFLDDMADLVLGLDGSLKAEHGTGRAMAPFVTREWGEEAVAVMREVKHLLDPVGLLNPGVLLVAGGADLADLKLSPSIGDDVVDRCVECGFCESTCPSRAITLTPRQRIAARRVAFGLAAAGELERAAAVWKDFGYAGRDTCVADGLCGTVCPAGINVAYLTDHDRAGAHGESVERVMELAARHFDVAEKGLRLAVDVGSVVEGSLGVHVVGWATAAGRRLFANVPQWSPAISKAPPRVRLEPADPQFVYFPACVSRILGSSGLRKRSLVETVLGLADKAELRLRLPEDTSGLCCGQIWQHKGFRRGHRVMANRLVEALWRWSEGGRLPIMCDVASCARTMLVDLEREQFGPRELLLTNISLERYRQLTIIDLVGWLHDHVLPRVEVRQKKRSVLLHPTCACIELGLDAKFAALAGACAQEVTVPTLAGCCGAGGDRGFLHPELADAALRDEVREIQGRRFDGAYSLGRTCEIVLSDRTGHPYESIAYLLDEATA